MIINLPEELKIKENISLSSYTTFRTGGNAKYLAEPETIEELRNLLSFAKDNDLDTVILGNGSNVLVSDEGIDELVIVLKKLKGIEKDGNKVTVLAGTMMPSLSLFARKNSLKGLEFMCGIPGTVGGGIIMNAGAYLAEISTYLENVTTIDKDLNEHTYSKDEMEFSYRHSSFATLDEIIVSAVFDLPDGNMQESQDRVDYITKSRKDHQPLEYPSAGSTFKKVSEELASAKLIDDAGLKGLSVGGAMVSKKHSGFIINYDHATSTDISELVKLVQKKVYEKYQIKIEPEIKYLGRF